MDRPDFLALRKPQPSRAQVTVSDMMVGYLEQLGVEYVFGVPGGAVEPFFDALARSARHGGPRVVTTRHESGAAFMADGYARESGRLGVCISTSGPGATNMLTGVACAQENKVPLLAISGQPALASFGRRSLQESSCTGINVVGMFRHCTRYDSLISHPNQAEHKLASAVMRAGQARGPVHLSLPLDVQKAVMGYGEPAYNLLRAFNRPVAVDDFALEELGRLLAAARRPVLVIGGGCLLSARIIVKLAERLGAPFVTTPDGKGFINPHHPLYRGVFGFAGHASAKAVVEADPDLIVVAGSALGELPSAGWSKSLLTERLVHVDQIEDNFLQSPMARLHVRGDLATVFSGLVEHFGEWQSELPVAPAPVTQEPVAPSGQGGVPSPALLRRLSEVAPSSVRVFADSGSSFAWAIHSLEVPDRREQRQPLPGTKMAPQFHERRGRPRSWLNVTMEFCAMGWAIGASIGAAMADRRGPVVCLTGDGSYLMNGQEITVAAAERLPVVFIILNDSALGMVMHGQRMGGAEEGAFEIPVVNFALLAQAMGVPSHVVCSEAELAALDFEAIFARRGPTLIDVRVDREIPPPIRVRTNVLHKT
jgi:acetolactate synthase I/II/III large subunit